jgi:2-polyprenyl-3-methyl-5-hydroxy-6-metoxy-1,4-benzoquinol methylase
MQKDFRHCLYERYVSYFKAKQSNVNQFVYNTQQRLIDSWFGKILSPLCREAKILEVGCGAGAMLAYLKTKGFTNFRGIDISIEQVELAQSKGLPAEIAEAQAYLNQFRVEFDLIIALDFIEHLMPNELLDLIEAVHLSLKPGGLLVLQTINAASLLTGPVVWGDLSHMTIFTPNSLRQLLWLYEFEDIKIWECRPVPHGVISLIRSILWKFVRLTAVVLKSIETASIHTVWTETMACVARKPHST